MNATEFEPQHYLEGTHGEDLSGETYQKWLQRLTITQSEEWWNARTCWELTHHGEGCKEIGRWTTNWLTRELRWISTETIEVGTCTGSTHRPTHKQHQSCSQSLSNSTKYCNIKNESFEEDFSSQLQCLLAKCDNLVSSSGSTAAYGVDYFTEITKLTHKIEVKLEQYTTLCNKNKEINWLFTMFLLVIFDISLLHLKQESQLLLCALFGSILHFMIL